jgi:hypothetical protein
MEGGYERKKEVRKQQHIKFLTFKVVVLRRLETSGPTHPETRCHIPENLNLQQSRCESLSGCSVLSPAVKKKPSLIVQSGYRYALLNDGDTFSETRR